ncbi:MAG: hypothetical protein ACR2H4_12790 [Pyrinomonadaceae bacterium]
MEKWFPRFGDVPGIRYVNEAVDRTRLAGHDAIPKKARFEFHGRVHESMHWPTKDGSTSASPAKTWETKPLAGETTGQTALRQLREALELPGTLTDYHFAIQHGHDELRANAREEPWILEEVERLCWLDIKLIEQYPETITVEPITIQDEELAKLATERRGERRFFGVSAFHQLIGLYEREGYLREALEVATIAERFEQCQGKTEELKERISRV